MLQQLIEIAREAGAVIRSARDAKGSATEKTGPRDLVTQYDLMVQELLRRRLLELLPEAGFLGEEGDHSEDLRSREWLFIVDPIDGTTNFIQGYHNSCVSIGLAHAGQMEYGVIYNPYDGELYAARRGRGATLNGSPIHCRDDALDHSLLIFGSALYYRELVPQTLGLFNLAFPLVQDVRRFGSAALDLCYLAAGKAGVFLYRPFAAIRKRKGEIKHENRKYAPTDPAAADHGPAADRLFRPGPAAHPARSAPEAHSGANRPPHRAKRDDRAGAHAACHPNRRAGD